MFSLLIGILTSLVQVSAMQPFVQTDTLITANVGLKNGVSTVHTGQACSMNVYNPGVIGESDPNYWMETDGVQTMHLAAFPDISKSRGLRWELHESDLQLVAYVDRDQPLTHVALKYDPSSLKFTEFSSFTGTTVEEHCVLNVK